ncbi:MAG: hypothetical protein ACODAU_07900 [Myxococcota bacterium]
MTTTERWTTAARRDAGRWWARQPRDVRWVVGLGMVLLGSGLFHLGVFAVDGGPWEGPVSWRKPIVFGLSGGVTSLSLAWVMSLLPAGRRRARLGAVYAWAMGLEVLLITLQRWRGVPSHFNRSTVFDGVVFNLMAVLILAVLVVTVLWTVDTWRARSLPPDAAAAARGGLLLLLAGHGVGIAIIVHANVLLLQGSAHDPAVFGAAGLLKIPHGLALHAIQALPMLAWLLGRTTEPASARARWVRTAAAGYALLLGFALLQAFSGRPPLEVTGLPAAVAGLGTLGLATPFAVAFGRLLVARGGREGPVACAGRGGAA